jgi:hypothetical protein
MLPHSIWGNVSDCVDRLQHFTTQTQSQAIKLKHNVVTTTSTRFNQSLIRCFCSLRTNMTYCVAMRLQEGLVFVSDSRTNAGVDHIAIFRKLHVFGLEGERILVLQSAGNLATSQAVVTLLRQRIQHEAEGHLHSVKTMYDAADLIGETLLEVKKIQRTRYGFFLFFFIGWANFG